MVPGGDDGNALQIGRLLLTGGDLECWFNVAHEGSSGELIDRDDKSMPGDTTTRS